MSHAQTYQRSHEILRRMGARLTTMDGTQALSALVHDVVVVNVHLRGDAQRTEVEVTGAILPGKVVLGSFTELDDFVHALRTEVRRAQQ
jgi:hypothetical protein